MLEVHPSTLSAPTVSDANVETVLQAMALAASRAPSGDNLQPWTFHIDAGNRRLEVWLEESADSTSLNSGQRMSRIACGAAVECAVCAAADYGWSTEVSQCDDRRVARIALCENNEAAGNGSMQRLIAERTTNRRLYDGQLLSPGKLAELKRATPPIEGSSAHWITERAVIDAFAQLAARADALLFGEGSMRRAFLKNVRFDLPLRAQAEHGLPLGALEVSFFERLTLRSLPFTPDWLFRFTPAPRMFAQYSKKLIRSSSGLCIITVDGAGNGELRAGRAMLRAWLELTALGMAVQPMMSCMAMLQALECGSAELIGSLGLKKLREFVAEFRTAVVMSGIRGTPQCLMRFGNAAPPSLRVGRQPLVKLLRSQDQDFDENVPTKLVAAPSNV